VYKLYYRFAQVENLFFSMKLFSMKLFGEQIKNTREGPCYSFMFFILYGRFVLN